MTSWMQVPYLLDGGRRRKALVFTASRMSVLETLRAEWLLFASVVGDILGVGASSEILIPLQCTEPHVTLLRGSCREMERERMRGLVWPQAGPCLFIARGHLCHPHVRWTKCMRCGPLWGGNGFYSTGKLRNVVSQLKTIWVSASTV